MDFITFEPLYQERVWGGRGLENRLGRKLPQDAVIGESWEIVDRPEAQSKAVGGEFDGQTLRALIEQHGEAIMGPSWPKDRPFPILVKWLDCQDRLSLQVHPPAHIAPSLGGEPKTENWYIVESEPGASLLVGLKPGTTREQFETALADGTAEQLVNSVPVRAGDSMFVYSGRIHAIDAGNLILEIQQNSDTTYRVYDWGRMGLDGKPRTLHVEESLKSIDWNDSEPQLIHPGPGEATLVDSEIFTLRRVPLTLDTPLHIATGQQPRILSVVEGALIEKHSGREVRRAANILLPRDGEFIFQPLDTMATVLLTEGFAGEESKER